MNPLATTPVGEGSAQAAIGIQRGTGRGGGMDWVRLRFAWSPS